MKTLQDVITPSDRRAFLKKVGFGTGALALGSVALPAALTKRLYASGRCTSTCPGSGVTYEASYTSNHNSTHSIWTNAMQTRTATATQAYNAYQAAIAHFQNLLGSGLDSKYQTNMGQGFQAMTSSQFNAIYNELVSTYGVHISTADAQYIFLPGTTRGQQCYNYVLSTMGGIWNSQQSGVSYEQDRTQDLQNLSAREVGSPCTQAAGNVETMFTGIAAVFGVAALIDPPALAVSAAAGLVAFGAMMWGRYYC